MSKLKVYIAGNKYNIIIIDFLSKKYQLERVKTMSEADVVIIADYGPLTPKYYNQTAIEENKLQYTEEDDKILYSKLNFADKANKFIIGIGKGADMLCARQGGKIIQYCLHQYNMERRIYYKGEKSEFVWGLFHKTMMYPYNLINKSYEVLVHSTNSCFLSHHVQFIYRDSNEDNVTYRGVRLSKMNNFKQPNVVYFKSINGLAISGNTAQICPAYNEKHKYCQSVLLQCFEEKYNEYLLKKDTLKNIYKLTN